MIPSNVSTAAPVRVESPFPACAVPRLWNWTKEFRHRVADDFAPKTLEEFFEHWTRSMKTAKAWGVLRGDELGGMIMIQPLSPVTGATHCIFKPEFWGRATTDFALKLAYMEVFDGGCNKLISTVFADNAAIIALAKRLGGRIEGKLRQNTRRDGKLVDQLVIGLLKVDFETAWRLRRVA